MPYDSGDHDRAQVFPGICSPAFHAGPSGHDMGAGLRRNARGLGAGPPYTNLKPATHLRFSGL
jgi:hypothetical protein